MPSLPLLMVSARQLLFDGKGQIIPPKLAAKHSSLQESHLLVGKSQGMSSSVGF
jgi:DNA-binding transcriptional regulator/RsmH inhibitor MraZ